MNNLKSVQRTPRRGIIFSAALTALALAVTVTSLSGCVRSTGKQAKDTTDNKYEENLSPDPQYGEVSADKRDDGKTVVLIDAGHGFGDVGCESVYGFAEKDLTIVIAEKLKAELEKGGAEVIMTHDGETFPSAAEITAAADRLGIEYKPEEIVDNNIFSAYERSVWENIVDAEKNLDLFISVHINSIENHPEISGFSIDYCENNPYLTLLRSLSADICGMLEEKYDKEVRAFEDTFEESYIVTKYTNVPSVLLECGYATNEADAADLQNDGWQTHFAENLAEVIIEYFK